MSRILLITGQSYGQRRPSLTVVLKRVLEGYPDGGQILKELIQNADDAGATEVKFLFDSRDNAFGTSSLINVGLSKFQGPALYVYNNALFKEQDWTGIESIMLGSKKRDPVAAGRFGVGFNSVYHVTDLPSVVSGHHVAFLDPQETYFGAGETGRRFDIREPLTYLYRDQFSPYEDVLSCKISSGVFDGTLFRLPLRKWPSKISIKPYTAGKINSLFESFMEEAPVVLLFLKNVEIVTIYETSWTEQEKIIFSVQVKEEFRKTVKEVKRKFIEEASGFLSKPFEMNYETVIEINRSEKSQEQFKFLVLNRVGFESMHLAELSSSLGIVPWAGVAASLDTPNENTKRANGRVFCYLPLPADSECKSGLPVHVHGAYCLTDNRRNLKWPGIESQSDEAAEWNICLTREVLSTAYANLVVALTRLQPPSGDLLPIVDNVWPDIDSVQGQWKALLKPFYAALADQAVFWTPSLGGKWIALKEGILDRMECSPNKVRNEVRDVIVDILLQADEPVIFLPQQAMKAVEEYAEHQVRRPKEITPSYVRAVLRGDRSVHSSSSGYFKYDGNEGKTKHSPRSPSIENSSIYELKGADNDDRTLPERLEKVSLQHLTRNEKLCLLEFILMDRNFTDLAGLSLLPLANNTFRDFQTDVHEYNSDDCVLIASRNHPQSLIPGSDERFLDENIERGVLDTLRSLAGEMESKRSGPTQLVNLSPSLVPKLVRESIPEPWRISSTVVSWDPKDESLPDDLWLRGLWSWLKTEFPKDLTPFEGIPLIPLVDGRSEKRYLIKLKKDHCLIQSSSYFASLPRNVVSALQKTGCIVLPHLPPFCDHAALKHYIEPPTSSGVLKVLATVMNEPGNDSLTSCTIEEKAALRAFLSSLRNPTDDEVVALMTLPIFQTMDGTTFTAVQSVGPLSGTKLDVAPPRLHLPSSTKIHCSHEILSATDDDSYQLLRRLPVRILSTSDFLVDKIFPYIESGGFYTREEVSNLMFWVIQRLPALSSDKKTFPDHLKNVPFVPVANGSLKPPSELYDPEDEIIQKLFQGEADVFPAQEFAKAHALSLLRVFLGLRRSRSLEAKDILLIAKLITGAPEQLALRRAEALLQFLNDNAYLVENEVLLEESSGSAKKVPLGSILSSLPWLPASKEPLSKYPQCMPWFGVARRLYSPKDMRDADMANIVGSSMPILRGNLDDKLKKAFGWWFPPPIFHVLDQLKGAITTWQQQVHKSSEIELLKFQGMLRDIYNHLSSEIVTAEAALVLKEHSFLPWIWYGSGFAKSSSVAMRSECALDLRPYIFVLSEDFQGYSSFFKRCGVLDIFNATSALEVLHMIRDWHLEKKRPIEEVKRDLHLSRDILDFLTKDGSRLSPDIRKRVLVPIQAEEDRLILQPSADVSYCDAEWLRLGNSDTSISDVTFMVHKTISSETARLLGTPPLSRKLAVTEPLGFQQSGPYEPVTTRLRNILKDHNDDMATFKELIQNADDAGATEVKFLLDWRYNSAEKLLAPGLAEMQGPALWICNDALFTDKDFENINKLAGGDLIKDKSRPGIRLNLRSNAVALSAFSDQFKPYQGVFGCTIDKNGRSFFYDGTLFRFPLRTMRQASDSEICNKFYDEQQFTQLISAFQENASKMLLFLQNVCKISFFQITSDQNPSLPNAVFEVEKDILLLPSTGTLSDRLTSEKNNNQGIRESDLNGSWVFEQQRVEHLVDSSKIVFIKFQAFPNSSLPFSRNQRNTEVWLVTSCYGERKAREMANTEDGKLNGLLPKAEVAALLSDNDKAKRWRPTKTAGEVFLGLPLGAETGFPVHVNGYFAVTTNRRSLWEDTKESPPSRKPIEVLWNQSLLEDAASKAYVRLLVEIVSLHGQGKIEEFPYDVLWPNPEKASSKTWVTFAYTVYQNIANGTGTLLRSQSQWVSFKDSVFLEEDVSQLPESYPIMCSCGFNVVQLPKFASNGFERSVTKIAAQTVTMDKFVCDIFFPTSERLPSNLKDPIICHVMDEYLRGSYKYEKILRGYRCIPTSPDGCHRSRPDELIDPTGAASSLYLEEEHIFPTGSGFLRAERLVALRKLGMVEALLPWKRICERVTFIATLATVNYEKALPMSRNLIKYLNDNLSKLSPPGTPQRKQLSEICFLPAMDRPTGYYLPWKGSEESAKRLFSAKELRREDSTYLLGAVLPLLDESPDTGCDRVSKDVSKLLRLGDQRLTVNDVLLQLYSAVEGLVAHDAASRECVRRVSTAVYHFLQERINTSDKQVIKNLLHGKPWIFVESKFVTADQVAFSWKSHGDPFLYCLPDDYTMKFKDLFKALGVRESFSGEDMVDALFVLAERKDGEPLTVQEFRTVKSFLEDIASMDDDALSSYCGQLPLPNVNLVLTPVGELTINDTPWIDSFGWTKCIHSDISVVLAHRLGAQTMRGQKLDKYSHRIGKPFGQSERLTDRLKGVLEAYPCDFGILKEIIQNADDAGATEVHFIHDPRQHGTTRILSEQWKDLQGPALCVYNDCPFTEKDFEGIQKLGIGSKTDSLEKAGKYGIGFNAVYHLTDCPSFITNAETLCVLDPHARYAPDATLDFPGRRFDPLDDEFWVHFADVRPCYLEEFFHLKGSTMFRLPVRNDASSKQSEISSKAFSNSEIDQLLTIFESEIRDTLLFLRNVTRVSISRIENNKLVRRYEASATISNSDIPKIQALDVEIMRSLELNTSCIPWFGITYIKTTQDTLGRRDNWLIHQCLGSRLHVDKQLIPEGSKNGLLPRAAVAACVTTTDSLSPRRGRSYSLQNSSQNNKIHRAFCFLPLPVETGLPVHINGQFILDNSRRNLWKDDGVQGARTQWNNFIKRNVLAPAYAELIVSARTYIPGISQGDPWYFNDITEAKDGLKWYHSIFPDSDDVHSEWKSIVSTVFRLLASFNQPVLPILRDESLPRPPATSPRNFLKLGTKPLFPCLWVPPCSDRDEQQALFSDLSNPELETLLLKIGVPIVHAPQNLYTSFKRAAAMVKTVSPEDVMAIISKPRHNTGVLPCYIDNTTFKQVSKFKLLIEYCMRDDNFLQRLNGMPLLLTEDEVLREFDSRNPVFLTPFSSLLSSQKDIFIHKEFIPLFSKFTRNEIWKSEVFKRFDTISIAPYLIQLLPSKWFAGDKHVPWEPTDVCTPSVEWLTMLWELIITTYQERQSSFEDKEDPSETLQPFEDWPIIPTSTGTLAPLSLGKTVLDLSTRIYDEDRLVRILCKIGSAQLDFSVLPKVNKDEASLIVSPHLAKPYSRQDVISVIHYLSKGDDFKCELGQGEIVTLLRFLQEDVTTVYSNQSLMRKLPLYKTLNGKFVSLDSYAFSYVVDLPQCVSLADIEARIENESCVLLEAIQEIEPLYKALDISQLSQVDVFVKYILPNFDAMSERGLQEVLLYIKDTLFVTLKSSTERSILIDALCEARIFPDKSDTLVPVSNFYDPENPVFRELLSPGDFPPGNYSLLSWLPFLRQVGLKYRVSQQQFIQFAESLASDAMTGFQDTQLRDVSKTLVTCLFQQDDLHDPSFLHVVSSIKFVAAETASKQLTNLQPQYACKSKEDIPPFTEFHGALPCEQQKISWTSIALLPAWATPNSAEKQVLEDLGVALLPPLDKVINHITLLTKAHSGNVHKDTPKDQRELLHDVIYETFTFLKGDCNCPSNTLSDKCTKSCLAIGSILKKTPCIPVEEGRVFVEGNQLAFETTTEMPPYFYKVPREYGHFEHVLKRLGANEKPTPSQFADVLGRLKEVCEDKHMEPNEKKVAREATRGFFTTLSQLVKEKSEEAATKCLFSLNQLFLPSKEGFLKPSNELIFHDCPSFERRARDFAGDFVDISREGELTADRLSYLLGLLPLRLRAKTIQNLLREEIHPTCRDKQCIADSTIGSDPCPFVNRYRNVLLSPKLVNGILRVIRHQRQTPNLPQDVKDQVQVLCSSLNVTCMASLDTHLIHLESGKPLQHSQETQDCFLEEQNGEWELFIRHGTDENPLHIQLCFQVNRLIHNQIEKEIYLQAMLACRVPEEILPSLDRCGVAQDLMGSEARTTEPVLGSEIPVMYHYLLRQDIEYFFRQGEIVGYEKERRTEDGQIDDSEPLYVYAKVVRKVPNRKRSMGTSRFDFKAKYRVDIGEPRLVEVSVLDLYKFDRSNAEVPNAEPELSDSREVSIFTGDPKESERRAASRNERLEKAKQEIKDTLWEAWKLPENERRKVIKRLFLRWHPDKNIGSDIANDVMQFLLNEIERMEKLFPSNWRDNLRDAKEKGTQDGASNFHDFFNQWNQRARQERQTYDTFKRQNHQGTPYSKRSTNPQKNEAKRWMKQAKEDLNAAKHLESQQTKFPALVCFLCQQATEKVFKGALYAACGISEKQLETHDVLNLAYEITELDGSPDDIALLAAKLKNYYEQTRYPHFHRGDTIPAEAFTSDQAQDALEICESLVQKINDFVNDNFARV
ncbi:Sacsin [Stylophora pistillata]|uniref:Sacsin n=1 Tax=Stylophora pistillata TaxID=50429 RepID=A0A2B4S6Z3_STYPI|nr:Sacsin [Stylophora pistillata]